MWLDKLDAELVKTETLQGLCLLHISQFPNIEIAWVDDILNSYAQTTCFT